MAQIKRPATKSQPEPVSPGDSIDYGLTFQINVERNLSVWLKAGITSTVREGETSAEAWKRVKAFVDGKMDELIEEYK